VNIETAQKAAAITRRLTPSMRKAMLSVVQADDRRSIDRETRSGTACALLDRGLITDRREHWHRATDLGVAVVAILMVGEERVIAAADPAPTTGSRPWPKNRRAALDITTAVLVSAQVAGWVSAANESSSDRYYLIVHVPATETGDDQLAILRRDFPYRSTISVRPARGSIGPMILLHPTREEATP
jgi:hypothetical protein